MKALGVTGKEYISTGVNRKICKRVYNGFLGIKKITIFYKEGRLYVWVVTLFDESYYECNITEL
jgi:hypothetical protein